MSRNMIVVPLFGLFWFHGNLSPASAMTPGRMPKTGVFTPTSDIRIPAAGRVQPDTTWFGGIDSGGHAVPGGTWDFSDGTLQGWTSVDMTDNSGVYFARVTASDFAGDPYTPIFPNGIGELWCGVHQAQANLLDYIGGMGYGNNFDQIATSPLLTIAPATETVSLSFKYLNNTEQGYDYTHVILQCYDSQSNRLPDYEVTRFTGRLGSYGSPSNFAQNVNPGTLNAQTTRIRIALRLTSDTAWSDEDGLWLTPYGPFAADDIVVHVGPRVSTYNFNADNNGWTFAKPPGVGRFIGLTGESAYQQWLSDAGIDSCVLAGTVMDLVREDGTHPVGQYERATSAPVVRANYEPNTAFQILAKAGVFHRNEIEAQTFFRFGYKYFPYTTAGNPNPRWSPLVGPGVADGYFENLGTTACETLSRTLTGFVPEDWDSLRMCVDVLNVSPGDASGAPLFDDLRIGVVAIPAVVANFGAEPTSGVVPLTVQFTDLSLGEPTSWQWDFDGNGTVDATTQNPTFTYASPGTYDVSLTVSANGLESTLVRPACITAELLHASFAGEPRTGRRPLSVSFADQSTGHPTGWAWDFDSNGTVDSAEQSPTFQYEAAGTYDVRLVVTRDARADTVTQADYIVVLPDTVTVESDGSGDYPTIEAAVDAAFPGMVVELGDGVFTGPGNREVQVVSKAITIRSRSGNPEDCILDCQRAGRAIEFVTVGEPGAVLSGITITHGLDEGDGSYGGGVACGVSSVTISQCRFVDNLAWENGGGLGVRDCPNVTVRECSFLSNSSGPFNGGGFFCLRSILNVENSTFVGNTANVGGAGYIWTYYLSYGGSLTITGSTLFGNSDGIFLEPENTLTLDRTIIAFSTIGAALGGTGTAFAATCCDVWGNANGPGLLGPLIEHDGNIAADPTFCDAPNGNFSLREDSPCLPEANPLCGQIGAWPVGCIEADFTGEPLVGLAPLTVTFADHTVGGNGWEWDFQADGVIDATSQNPVYTYTSTGSYSVFLRVLQDGEQIATGLQQNHFRALDGTNIVVMPTTIASSSPTAVPVGLYGSTPVGAISLYFEYDPADLTFQGVESYVPGEVFAYGIVGGRISVQWFDESGGQDPIRPGVDPTNIFGLRFTPVHSGGTTALTVDEGASALADDNGIDLPTTWVDDPPFGIVTLTVGAVVSGDVLYYWQDKAVPDAWLSMGPPNPDISSNESGRYQFAPYPSGDYVLTARKTTDLLGINALDAVKIVRHATGQEILDDPHKLQAADVNGNGSINSLDAFKVVRVAVGLETIPGGDWRFDPPSWSFQPLNSDQERDFVAVRMGDVNGDWVAGRAAAGEGGGEVVVDETKKGEARPISTVEASGGARIDRTLTLPDTSVAPAGPNVTVSLRVTGFDAIGAISLRIQFDPSVVYYVGLTSGISGVSFTVNLVGNELRIEWFDSTGGLAPITIGSGVLLRLEFDPIGPVGSATALDFTSLCSIGDAEGDPIPDAVFQDGRIQLLDLTGVDGPTTTVLKPNLELLPTVGTGSGMLAVFRLVKSEDVQIRVFSVDGRLVRVLVNRAVSAGVHQERWDGLTDQGTSAGAGLYFVRMSLGSWFTQTRRFALVR